MQLPTPFERVGDHVGIALPGGRALFTTRRGGVSEGAYASLNLGRWTDDDADAVRRNREIVAALVGVALEAVVQGRQVHGTRVEPVAGPLEGAPPEADGVATAADGLAASVLTADCLPVALIAPEAVAMVHAGWRGLAGGVLEEGVGALRTLGASRIEAAIGPGAGGCCYEVGDEVRAAFAAHPAAQDRRRVDLKAIARERLDAAGVAAVHDAGLCTLCAEPGLFFSHRRDGGVTGRQAGIAWRTPAGGAEPEGAWRS